MMKTVLFAATAAVALLASSSAGAVAINLYNTGVDAGGNSYGADGFAELHYQVNGGTGVTYKHPAWYSASDAYWIAAAPGGGYSINPGVYTLQFDLTGFNAATASIAGNFAIDDGGSVQLNGGTAINTTGGFSSLTAFSFNSGFNAGINTLTFNVVDTGGVPAGLLVSGLSGTVDVAAVPEPATWGLMVLGFGGMGYAMRRRRTPITFNA